MSWYELRHFLRHCGAIFNPLTTNVPHPIETSQLICSANQWTGFYMMGNFCRLAFDPIKLILRTLDTFFMVKKMRFLQNVSINFVNWRDSLSLAEAKMREKGKNFCDCWHRSRAFIDNFEHFQYRSSALI